VHGGTIIFPGRPVLPITHLSLRKVEVLPGSLLPTKFPFLRTLHFDAFSLKFPEALRLILPQITSLYLTTHMSAEGINNILDSSLNATYLSCNQSNLINLSSVTTTTTSLRDHIITLRITGHDSPYDGWKHTRAMALIGGSKKLKKIYLDPSSSFMGSNVEMMRRKNELVSVCLKNGIEVWAGVEGREIELTKR
jgi:hypothetical protein